MQAEKISEAKMTAKLTTDDTSLACHGAWQVGCLALLEEGYKKLTLKKDHYDIDGSELKTIDMSGAWLLLKILEKLDKARCTYTLKGFAAEHLSLVELVRSHQSKEAPPKINHHSWVWSLGRGVIGFIHEGYSLFCFIGELALVLCSQLIHPTRMRWRGLLNTIEGAGWYALPIVGLLSFLVGMVLAYQMGLQLLNYGASIFVVDLLGVSLLREFSPFIAAIIVAGRTGAAYAAELGTMIANEEVDALRTMGFPPIATLVVPRVLGLLMVLPLLMVWGYIFGMLGGIVMAHFQLNISFHAFFERAQEVVSLKAYVIGLAKAWVFGMIIAIAGCFQGLQASGDAGSVGKHTTKAVVQSIFLIIVADAAFSIVLGWMGL